MQTGTQRYKAMRDTFEISRYMQQRFYLKMCSFEVASIESFFFLVREILHEISNDSFLDLINFLRAFHCIFSETKTCVV